MRFKQNIRFRRPEFQNQLKKARSYQRESSPRPTTWATRVLEKVGLGSFFGRVMFLVFVLVVFYFLAISKTFLIREVSLASEGFTEEEIETVLVKLQKERKYFIPKNHWLLLNSKKILKVLQKEIPEVHSILKFERVFPNKLKLALEERKPSFVWQSGDNYYLLDQEGVVFQKILNYETASYPEILITDQAETPVGMGEELPIKKIISFIQEAQKLRPAIVGEPNFKSFAISHRTSSALEVKTVTGFVVFFDLERRVEIQFKNLAWLLKQGINPETHTGLSYIDLRLPKIGYYCYKDAPCALEKELELENKEPARP